MNVIVFNGGNHCVIFCDHNNTLIIDRDTSQGNRIIEDALKEVISTKQQKDENVEASRQRTLNSRGTQTVNKEDISRGSQTDNTSKTKTQEQGVTGLDAYSSPSSCLTGNQAKKRSFPSAGNKSDYFKKKKEKEENSDSFENHFSCKKKNCEYCEIIGCN